MRAKPMNYLAAVVLIGGLLTGISCKQTKTGSAAVPQGDPLLPSTVTPPLTPVKSSAPLPTDSTAGHGK